jgi:tRNA dimethylallyltransferase
VIPDFSADRKPILIAGPTASGKSGLALTLAERFGGAIVNADALQVYASWRVLTARPDASEEARAPHYLYGHIGLNQPYSVGHWLREVEACLTLLQNRDLRPIIVGGTGLYFRALTRGLADIPTIPAEIRQEANRIVKTSGESALAEELREEDPATYSKIDINNPARTQRAWEVLRATGRGLADWHDETPPPLLPLERTHALHLHSDTDWLNRRIEVRFDQMIEQGALEECRAVLESGWDPSHPSCQAIGAKELIGFLQGEMALQEAIELAKIQTRQYAKRQRTWFRSKMRDWHQIETPDGLDTIYAGKID